MATASWIRNSAFFLLAAGGIYAAEMGKCLGHFDLRPLNTGFAKSSAACKFASEVRSTQAVARLASGFDVRTLAPLGWSLVSNYKGIAILEGDASTLTSLQDLPGILEIRTARKVTGSMEVARNLSRVDWILNWGPNPATAGVTGKGSLIGVVDFGFETHHPAFLDSTGKTRFLAVWDPNLPTVKGAPFGRGQVKSGAQLEADIAFGEKEGDEHGTNVASVAAGGNPLNAYYGVAPEAELIGVNLSSKNDSADLETNIMNGIQWIFQVADSLKKPCVINLSLGNQHFGPHDGTSLFDKFIDSTSGPGHIVVGAAGNDGDKKIHGAFKLAASVDTTGSFTPVPAFVDLWGEVGKAFRFQVLLMDSVSHDYMTSTNYLSTSTGTGRPLGDSIVWTNPTTKKTQGYLLFVLIQRANTGNSKPHVEIEMVPAVRDTSPNPQLPMLGFRLLGSGTVQGWSAGSNPFFSMGINKFVDGDNRMTLSEIGGTAKSIISVGSYVSTSVYTDYTGKVQDSIVNQKVGELATWSSQGPAADGRVKPDLCAPGRMIISALSSAMVNPFPWQIPRIVLWPDQTNKLGRYFAAEGTSLSAPIVTGVLALMLETNPNLTPAQAKDILSKSAYQDEFTGPLAPPDGLWGAGKLDAAAAVNLASGGTVQAKNHPIPVLGPRARYWAGLVRIDGLTLPSQLDAWVCDWKGRRVARLARTTGNGFHIDGKPLKIGVYFAVLTAPQKRHVLPFLLETR